MNIKPDMTNKKEAVAHMTEFFQHKGSVTVTANSWHLWAMLCTVQLACRHPRFTGPSRAVAVAQANEMAAAIFGNDEGMKRLWAMGWEESFDA